MKDEISPDITSSPFYFPIKRPVTITMAVLTAVVFGVLSYGLLPINLMPEISYPSLTVRTEYPGAAPEEVESSITRPLEQSLGVVRSLTEMSSSSRAEICDVLLEFDWNSDMDKATQDVREKLDVVFLPEDAKPPLILRYDPSLDPIIRIGLTSDSLELLELRRLTEDIVKRELDKLPGVAAVKIKGGDEAEINVAIDAKKIELLNLPLELILQRLASENVNLSGGHLQEGDSEYIIRTLNEFRSVEEIGEIIIDFRFGSNIRLREVADVRRIAKERTTITRVNGKESVEIEIYKESDANPIAVSDLVKFAFFGRDKEQAIAKDNEVPSKGGKSKKDKKKHRRGAKSLSELLTKRIQINILSNQAEFIQSSIEHVKSSALIGGGLAVIVLLLFLGRIQDTLAVGLVIPISLLCTFAAMHMAHVTMNIMSLGGLALGIGMMVDNAIVVIESIHRRREQGDSIITATVIGTQTVGGAVIASTLTTIVVFFPIVFVKGIAGQIFGDMALTVIISLSVSLIVALFVIPMLITRTIKQDDETAESNFRMQAIQPWIELKSGWRRWLRLGMFWRIIIAPISISYILTKAVISWILWLLYAITLSIVICVKWTYNQFGIWKRNAPTIKWLRWGHGFRRLIELMTLLYVYLLKLALRQPIVILFFVAIICTVSFGWILPMLGGELIPEVSQGVVNFELSLPVGTPLERTAELSQSVEETLDGLEDVKIVSSSSGGDLLTADAKYQGPHNSTLTVLINPTGDMEAKESKIVSAVRKTVQKIPSLGMVSAHPTLFTFKQPLEIIIKDNNLDRLRQRGLAIEARLSKMSELADVESTIQPGYPEISVRFDRNRLARLGLTPREAAQRIKTSLLGNVPTLFRQEEQRIDVRVQLSEDDRQTLEQLRRLIINPDQRIPVTLSEVAELNLREGPAEINRFSGTRAATITAALNGVDLKTATEAVELQMSSLGLNEGYDYIISGQRREMDESLGSLKFALLLALFLVYVVMASQFESLMHPFLILLTIPLTAGGLIPILWAIQMPLSMILFLGLIVLVGIVVNDSIVLVDYANQLVRKGVMVQEAIITAGRDRFRPILMTSVTTIFALLPMALGVGEGVEIRRPMAVTVIFGLTISTMVSLFIIPLLYRLVSRSVNVTQTESAID